jgi:hypothetical protein
METWRWDASGSMALPSGLMRIYTVCLIFLFMLFRTDWCCCSAVILQAARMLMLYIWPWRYWCSAVPLQAVTCSNSIYLHFVTLLSAVHQVLKKKCCASVVVWTYSVRCLLLWILLAASVLLRWMMLNMYRCLYVCYLRHGGIFVFIFGDNGTVIFLTL